MSFLTYHLNYYTEELQKLESCDANQETIYHAKQLLKILDDLQDEGYTELQQQLEMNICGVSRLHHYLQKNNATPFMMPSQKMGEDDCAYDTTKTELKCAVTELMKESRNSKSIEHHPFLPELLKFCHWIDYKEDTAYIFLLRDTLLPYIYFMQQNRKNLYPWLLSRKMLNKLTGKEYVDDEIRSSVYHALESVNCHNDQDFCHMVLPEIRHTIHQYPGAEQTLKSMLDSIKEKRILVIESGCCATFPLLLKSLDERVEFCMYTTYPYLLEIFGERIYTHKYEEIRLFESLSSQDLFFQFSDFQNQNFYVNRTCNETIKENAYKEVKTFLNSVT